MDSDAYHTARPQNFSKSVCASGETCILDLKTLFYLGEHLDSYSIILLVENFFFIWFLFQAKVLYNRAVGTVFNALSLVLLKH